MRPYRGKRKNDGEWMYGWLVHSEKHGMIYGIYSIFNDDNLLGENRLDKLHTLTGYAEVYPETVGQQVGLKDKNGKEGYAGDRVDIPRFDYPFIIKWDSFHAKYYMQSEQNNHIIDMRFLPEEGEIISNVHDGGEDA